MHEVIPRKKAEGLTKGTQSDKCLPLKHHAFGEKLVPLEHRGNMVQQMCQLRVLSMVFPLRRSGEALVSSGS